MIRKFGWIKDDIDRRDFRLAAPQKPVTFPPVFSLRSASIPVYDQLDQGSCVWNGLAYQDEYCQLRQPGGVQFRPSREYGYYWTRVAEWTVNEDAGCMPRNALKVYAKRGCCKESEWPYSTKKMYTRPPLSCDLSAAQKQALVYESVDQTENGIKACLFGNGKPPYGFPVGFGSLLFRSFSSRNTTKTGHVDMPLPGEQEDGGHYQVVIGWRMTSRGLELEVRNSWNDKWGDHGHAWFPLAYILNRNWTSDLRRITMVEE